MRIERIARHAAALTLLSGLFAPHLAYTQGTSTAGPAVTAPAPSTSASSPGGPPARAAAASGAQVRRPAQQRFESPDAAVSALVEAVRAEDRPRILRVLGPGGRQVIDSGDRQIDGEARARFLAAYERGHEIEFDGEGRATLLLGEERWPLPFPLVRGDAGRWRFDTAAGVQEYLDRQVGQNELDVLKVMDAYVQAQREYAKRDYTKNGLLEYAQRIVSSEGQRDGLYWPPVAGEPPSPMGARFALAALGRWRGTDDDPQPFHGYYFRPLTAQGRHAPGGAYDYLVNGHQIGGFALVAWPAQWGVTGVMTFMVNHDGVVYSRNLGPQTPQRVARIERFDPGPGWKREPASP